jgi:hypothetical protein
MSEGTIKTFVKPTRAINNDVPVNLLVMSTFNKKDNKDVRNRDENGQPKMSYSIVFSEPTVAKAGQTIEWRYASEACRDQDFDELESEIVKILGTS